MSQPGTRLSRVLLSLAIALCLGCASVPVAFADDSSPSVVSDIATETVEVGIEAAGSDEPTHSATSPDAQGLLPTRVEQSAPEVLLSDGWTSVANASMSGGSYAYARTAGARAAIEFTGTSVAWIGPKYLSYGQAEVVLDGVSQGVVSQYAPALALGQVIWSATGLSDGNHRLEIRVLQTKEPASTFFSVCIDAFDIEGTVLSPAAFGPLTRYEDDDPLISYGAGWTPAANAHMSGFGYRYAREGAAVATVRFQGTGIGYVAPKWVSYGEVRVVLDGVEQGTVSLAAPRALDRQVVWARWDLAEGEHVLELHSLGTHESGLVSCSVFVDAFDVAGFLLDSRGTGAVTVLEQDDSRLSFSNFWTEAANATMSGGSYRYCKVPDAGFSVEFSGTGISWLAPKYSSYGRAEVLLDGVTQGVVSLYSPDYEPTRAIWSIQGLTDGRHTLTVRTLGTKDPWSRHFSVCADRFEITGAAEQSATRLEDDDSRPAFTGGWESAVGAASGGTVRWTERAGAELLVDFRGTGITLIGPVGPDLGQCEVFVDGVSRGVVSQYAAATASQVELHAITGLAGGQHTFRLVALGTADSGSSGVRVAVDALEVFGWPLRTARTVATQTAEDSDTRLYFSGNWTVASYGGMSGLSHRYSLSAGSAVTITFEGTGVRILGSKHPAYGLASVELDGVSRGTTTNYMGGARSNQRVVWAIDGLAPGKHTVVLKVLGQNDPQSTNRYVSVDSVEVEGVLVNARPRAPFPYRWSRYIVIDKSDFKLYYVVNGYIEAIYPVAHGKPSTPTPSRVWRIDSKYYTDPSGVYGPRKMRLYRQVWNGTSYSYVYTAYGIHGTNEPWVIGTQASHGCIRLYNSDILKLFPQVPLGTMVVTRD
jgi:hypothetical protein